MYAVYRGRHCVSVGLSYRAAYRYCETHPGTRFIPMGVMKK